MANFDVVDLDKVLDDFEDDLDGEEEKNGIGIKCWTQEAHGNVISVHCCFNYY